MANTWTPKYGRERYHRLLDEARTKLGGKCVRCGKTEDLQFDHIDRTTKLFCVSEAAGHGESLDAFWAEVAKCQLLCRLHHIEKGREAGDIPQAATHGALNMYTVYKCRCDLCRAAWNAYCRENKKKHRIAAAAAREAARLPEDE